MARKKQLEVDIEEIRGVFTKPFQGALEPLLGDDVKAKAMAERLADMRKYAVERHDYYERYRNQYLAVGLAMLPLSFAIGGFILSFIDTAKVDLPWAAVAGVGVLCFAVTGLMVVFAYIDGTSPNYCYRKVARVRSWYHAYSGLAGVGDADHLCPDAIKREMVGFADALEQFGGSWIESMKASWRPVAEDIEQVFILFLLQSVKRRQVRWLAGCVKWGMSIGSVLLLVGFIQLAFGIGSGK